jgi:hypothetical protein
MTKYIRSSKLLSRRDFVKLSGGASLGMLLAGCGVSPPPRALPSASPVASPTVTLTVTSTATTVPTATLTAIPSATITSTSTPALTPTDSAAPSATATVTQEALKPAKSLVDLRQKYGAEFLTSLSGPEEKQGGDRVVQGVLGSVDRWIGGVMLSGQASPHNVEKDDGTEYWGAAERMCQTAYARGWGLDMSYVYEAPWMTPADLRDIDQAVARRIDHFISMLQPVKRDQPVVSVNLMNDLGEYLLDPNDPLRKKHGDNWPTWLYFEFLSRLAKANRGKAPERQVILGRDVRLMFSTFDIETIDGAQSKPTTDFLKAFRSSLPVFETQLAPEVLHLIKEQEHEMVLDVGMTLHLSGENQPLATRSPRPLPPGEADFVGALDALCSAAPSLTRVLLREMEVKFKNVLHPDQERRITILADLIVTFEAWGLDRVERGLPDPRGSICLYNTYLFPAAGADPSGEFDYGDSGLIDPNSFQPTAAYRDLISEIDTRLATWA